MNKKYLIISLIIVLVLIVGTLIGLSNLGSEQSEDKLEKISIATLSGPTGFGLAYLMDNENYDVEVNEAPDQVSAKLINGEVMFATIPTNMAAILNNKTNGKIKILSVIAQGNLYVLTTNDEINGVEDLYGRTITLAGKGATPEVIALDLFKDYNVTLDFKSEHAEVVSLMKTNKSDIVLLPEPYVTMAQKEIENLKVIVNINDVWKNKYENLDLPMGSLVMNIDYINNASTDEEKLLKITRVERLMTDVANSIYSVNRDVTESSKLIEEKGIIKVKDIAKDAISNCNIVFVTSEVAKDMLDKYFEVIKSINAKLIGGKIPNEEIYYK